MSCPSPLVTCLWLGAAVAASPGQAPDPAPYDEAAVVTVRAYDSRDRVVQSAGFVIGPQDLVVASHRINQDADRFTVVTAGGAELTAHSLAQDDLIDVLLLRVPGLKGTPLTLSAVPAEIDDVVTAPVRAGPAEVNSTTGRVVQPLVDVSGVPGLIQHTAFVGADGYGSPLLNECGEVVAVNVPAPDVSTRRLRRGQAPEVVVLAVGRTPLVRFLEGVAEPAVAEQSCLSALEQARAEAEASRQAAAEAAERAAALKAAAEEAAAEAARAQAAAEATDEERRAAERAAEEALAKAEDAEAQAAAAAEQAATRANELEEARTEVERLAAAESEARERADSLQASLEERTTWALWAAVGVGVLLLAILLAWWLVTRRNRRLLEAANTTAQQREHALREAQARASAAIAPAPFGCVLSGRDAGGRSVVLQISAAQLGDPGGVVVGRNPGGSGVVLNHEGVSRRHVKLSVEGDLLHAEDLGSSNGTSVDGRRLQASRPTQVSNGSTLLIGPISFDVRLVR